MSENDYQVLPENIKEPDCSFKIIIIGDSSVGKSSLALRGTKDKYKDFYTPTIGFEFLSLNIRIKKKIIKLQIWDTCGQEIYRSLISSFYRNSTLAIIVYAINDMNSFENVESWLDEIKCQTNPNLKIILIGNKLDLEEERVIQKDRAEKFCRDHNLDFFMETSAKTGVNTQLIFIKAAQILYDEYLQYSEKEEANKNGNKSKYSFSLSSNYTENDNDKYKDDSQRRKECHC